MLAGLALIVVVAPETAPNVKVTAAVSVIALPAMVPVMVTPSATVLVTVAVYVPSVLSVTALMIALPVVDSTTASPPVVRLLLLLSFA